MVLRRFLIAFVLTAVAAEIATRLLLPSAIDHVEANDWLEGHPYLSTRA